MQPLFRGRCTVPSSPRRPASTPALVTARPTRPGPAARINGQAPTLIEDRPRAGAHPRQYPPANKKPRKQRGFLLAHPCRELSPPQRGLPLRAGPVHPGRLPIGNGLHRDVICRSGSRVPVQNQVRPGNAGFPPSRPRGAARLELTGMHAQSRTAGRHQGLRWEPGRSAAWPPPARHGPARHDPRHLLFRTGTGQVDLGDSRFDHLAPGIDLQQQMHNAGAPHVDRLPRVLRRLELPCAQLVGVRGSLRVCKMHARDRRQHAALAIRT